MNSLLLVTVILYVLSAVLVWRQIAQVAAQPKLLQLFPVAAVAVHVYLFWQHLQLDQFDHINITTSLSAVAILLTMLSLAGNNRGTGSFMRPAIYLFAAVSAVLMILSPANWGTEVTPALPLVLHIVLSLLAYAVLMLATLYAIQMLYLSYLLKHHKSHSVSRHLPPLMTLEHYFFRLVSTGTVVLFLALLTGFVFLDDMFAQGQAHKTILSSIAALLYLLVVFLHGALGKRGRTLAVTSLCASALLTLAYFGSRFVKDILLNA